MPRKAPTPNERMRYSRQWDGHLYDHTGPIAAYRVIGGGLRRDSGNVAAIVSPAIPEGSRVNLDGRPLSVEYCGPMHDSLSSASPVWVVSLSREP